MIESVTVPEGRRGKWSVERFEVKPGSIAGFRAILDGRGCKSGTFTMLKHDSRGVIMSDTTAERSDHLPFIRAATGHCLINGLGLGMCVAAILRKPEVERVTVVEIDPDVIALVGPHYASDRVEIVRASAYDYVPPKGVRYGAVWHDIWDDICLDNLDDMKRLHRKYGRRTDWQGSWSRPQIEHIRRRDARRGW